MASSTLRVLLAEQEFSETGLTLRSVCAEAGWTLEMVFVDHRTDLAHALLAHCPDVAFLQLSLLQPDPPALVHVLHRSFPSIPFILFADPADKESVASCLSKGARDFILEGFMDERTMARTLRSVVPVPSDLPRSSAVSSTVNRHSRLAAPGNSADGDEFVVSICIEEFQEHSTSAPNTGPLFQQFEQALRGAIRSYDRVTRRASGEWIVLFTGLPEVYRSSVIRRMRENIAAFRPIGHVPSSFVFSIAICESSKPSEGLPLRSATS